MLAVLDEYHPLRPDAEAVRDAAERAASLTRQLLAFGRRQVLQPRPLDARTVVARVKTLLGRLIAENIEIVSTAPPRLGLVRADPGQLEQVIVNLALNARDAMPTGGRLTIELANAEVSEEEAAKHPEAIPPGSYVLIRVGDTGRGMDEETRARVFEPFFTTKERWEGAGLGLATVYGIVKQSGAYISVDSSVGRGTTFSIYFPPFSTPGPDSGVEPAAMRARRGALRGDADGLEVVEGGGSAAAVRATEQLVATVAFRAHVWAGEPGAPPPPSATRARRARSARLPRAPAASSSRPSGKAASCRSPWSGRPAPVARPRSPS
jgi:hypothetical protein